MSTVKDEAKRLIDQLPDSVTWDDIMYELYVRKKVEQGVKDSEEGRIVAHEDVKQMFSQR